MNQQFSDQYSLFRSRLITAEHISFSFDDSGNESTYSFFKKNGWCYYKVNDGHLLILPDEPFLLPYGEKGLFHNFTKMKTIEFNDAVKMNTENMDDYFVSCKSLQTADLRALDISGTYSIRCAFRDCISLENVFFPDRLYRDENGTFKSECRGLFMNCESLPFEGIHSPVRFPAPAYLGYQNLPKWDGEWMEELEGYYAGWLRHLPALATCREVGFFAEEASEKEKDAIQLLFGEYVGRYTQSYLYRDRNRFISAKSLRAFCEALGKSSFDLDIEAYLCGVPMEDILAGSSFNI